MVKVIYISIFQRSSTPSYILACSFKTTGTARLCMVGGRCNVCHESLNGTLRWHMNQHLQKYETTHTTNLFIHFATCILIFNLLFYAIIHIMPWCLSLKTWISWTDIDKSSYLVEMVNLNDCIQEINLLVVILKGTY